ncbi:MAG: hypothetical protein IM638_06240 [Bacteroidetes bacterium]|nr:hypothetical protein [Bacteroidota bacterium]
MLFRLTLLLLLLTTLGSCFHKDVMEDRADDIKCVLLYHDNSGARIIAREEIFQATSKSSGGGMTRISGYSEYRLSAYDVATGKLLARVELGEGMEESECLVLGIADQKIWLFSMNPELGFHSRSPKTLEIIETQTQLAATAPFTGFKFAVCEWSQINRHYGMSVDQKNVMLSDIAGFRYAFDPKAKTLRQTTEEIMCNDSWSSSNSITNNSLRLSKEETVSLSGEPRRFVEYQYKPTGFKNSYLKGEFLMVTDLMHLAALRSKEIAAIDHETDSLTQIIRQLRQQFPRLTDESGWFSEMSNDERDAYRQIDNIKRDTTELMRNKRDINSNSSSYMRYTALMNGRNAFIMHSADVTDTSKLMLTSLEIADKSSYREKWTTRLNRYYFNPDKADAAGAFETVFSDGNPEFRFRWFEIADDKLIVISQLQMCCIDLNTGRILWDNDL